MKRAALLPSFVFAATHFALSAIVGPQANAIFQRQFDIGAIPVGAEATVMAVNRLLSIPIPALLLASNPARIQVVWWVLTTLNSLCWGTVLYCVYLASARSVRRRADCSLRSE